MQYQSFPGVKGGSRSLEKLSALRLPPLAGKRFLDVGCNEGFFCGFAHFDGARQVVGIDRSRAAIRKAALRFPQVEFHCQPWDTLPEGPFDVITLLSALHYADDQEALIHRLMERLADDGLLVLEISMAPGSKDEWVRVERAIDERLFPTRTKLGSVLSSYAWKVIGHSVNQAGDPLQRYVVHVRRLKPYVWLLLEDPGSGKTTIGRRLFAENGVPLVSGDAFYFRIAKGKVENVSAELQALVAQEYASARIDSLTQQLFVRGFGPELVGLWVQEAGFRDFALDSYVPETYRGLVRNTLTAQGYFPVDIAWSNPESLPSVPDMAKRVTGYRSFLSDQARRQDHQRVIQVLRKTPAGIGAVLPWHLDAPSQGEVLPLDQSVRVAGWALPAQGDAFEVIVRAGSEERRQAPDRKRRDVVKAVLGDLPDEDVRVAQVCGFAFDVPVEWIETGCELILHTQGKDVLLAHLGLGRSRNGGARQGLAHRLIGKWRKRS